MTKWIFLSYELSENLSGYGDGDRFKKEITRSISTGDTSNNEKLQFPAHIGTHIDFPYHFCNNGRSGSAYEAREFVFSFVQCVEVNITEEELLITPEKLPLAFNNDTELLIVKTGYSSIRNGQKYWNENPGFAPACADHLKKLLPSLKAIAFDSISLSSWKHREVGREAHKAFLCDHQILIIEDVDLSNINKGTKLHKVIISPLRFEKADGTPVTIFAEIEEND